jgi:exoribonuclease R
MNKLIISRPSYKECNINNVVIDSQIIIKNKCFHQDELNDDFSVSMSKRDDFLIGGVIKLRNTYTFGNNDKGVEMFEFIPINWRYPRFLVPTNIKKNLIKNKDKVLDQFVVVRYKEWKSKLPIGYIDKHLGNVENLVAQYEILFYYYPTMPIVKPKMMEGGLADYKEPTQITIEDGCGDEIYSVDPEGCIDIDDAFEIFS